MSNSAVVRALRRRISFYLNSPVFNKYGRSLRDFLAVTTMVIGALVLMLFALVLYIDGSDVYYGGFASCGTPECIDQ